MGPFESVFCTLELAPFALYHHLYPGGHTLSHISTNSLSILSHFTLDIVPVQREAEGD